MGIMPKAKSRRQNTFILLYVVDIIFGIIPIFYTHITYSDIIGYLGILNGIGAVYIGGETYRPTKHTKDEE